MQTWVEGEPVKGNPVKPLKPTKAAALELLQQLALEHRQPATDSSSVSELHQDEPISSEIPSVADRDGLTQPAASVSTDSDSEAGASPRGGIAADKEDDRQAPEVAEPSSGQTLEPATADPETSNRPSGSLADKAAEDEQPGDSAADSAQISCSFESGQQFTAQSELQRRGQHVCLAKPSLAKVIQQQRRRLLRSSLQAGSEPQVSLAVTEGQQKELHQQMSEAAGSNLQSNTHAASEEAQAASGQAQAVSGQMIDDSDVQSCGVPEQSQPMQLLHGNQFSQQQLDEIQFSQQLTQSTSASSQVLSQQQEGQDMLWQELGSCLQDKQSAQKLAGLTVTLLARL